MQANGRQGDDGPDGHGDEAGQQQRRQPGDVAFGREPREAHGPDAGERGVAQRDLTAGFDQQPQRQHQQGLAQAKGEEGLLGAGERGHQRQDGEADRPGAKLQLERSGPLEWRPGFGVRAGRQAMFGDHQQHDEQHEKRQGIGEPVECGPFVTGHLVTDDVLDDPDEDAPGKGDRDAPERPDGGGSKGVRGQKCEVVRLQADRRQDQDARQRGEGGADHPGDPTHPNRARALQCQEVRVVDDRSHRRSQSGVAEQDVERGDGCERNDGRNQLVAEHVGPGDSPVVVAAITER